MDEKRVLRNKPVGYHEVDYLLSCNHVSFERIEAVIFIPKVGDNKICKVCNRPEKITRMGSAYWVDEENQ